jgi:hypothetical protein
MEKDEIEVIDEEIGLLEEQHKKETETLLTLINRREELVGLLKIAKPEKVADIRSAISSLDKSIESTENIIALNDDIILQKREYAEQMKNLLIMSETVLEGMREHLADDSEKLEMLEAMHEDDGKTH